MKKLKLRTKDRNVLFKKEYSELKIKVALNWFEILTLVVVTFFASFKVLHSFFHIEVIFFSIGIAILIALGIALLFCCFRGYQLKITRFDKEHIYKKISDELMVKKCS